MLVWQSSDEVLGCLARGLFESPQQFGRSQHVALHRLFQISFAGPGVRIQLRVQGVKPKVIAMRSRGWARARVPVLSGIILTLYTAIRQPVLVGCVLWNVMDGSGDVIEHPMGIAARNWSIGIVHDQSKRFSARGRPAPGKFRRNVSPFAG